MSETARKPFNLQEALAGKPVVTRDGRKVLSITHLPTVASPESVFAHIEGDDYADSFTTEGQYINGAEESDEDLFMSVEEKTVWLNIYPVGWLDPTYFPYPTEEIADDTHNLAADHHHPRLGNKAHKITWIED